MYLFNKKEEASITDERDLNNYLNHTKTFIVELSTTNNKKSYEAIYEEAENKTNNSMKNRPKVAIDEVIESFKDLPIAAERLLSVEVDVRLFSTGLQVLTL